MQLTNIRVRSVEAQVAYKYFRPQAGLEFPGSVSCIGSNPGIVIGQSISSIVPLAYPLRAVHIVCPAGPGARERSRERENNVQRMQAKLN